MAKSSRSLQASIEGLKKAKNRFKGKGQTQDYLAGAVGCSRQTINNFLARRRVDKGIFQSICTELGLEWREIAELEPGEEQAVNTLSIDELVQTARENKILQESIKNRCSTMRVLDMDQPLGLDNIYISVNILEKITGHRRLEIAELLRRFSLEDFERFSLSTVNEKRVPGLTAANKYSKLMILGKPGAGKTTFLKYLALQCIEGRFQPERIPLFITLKDFAEAFNNPTLLEYLIQIFVSCGIAPNTKIKSGFLESLLNWRKADTKNLVDLTTVEQLLNQGKLLILLDGLDEVKEEDSNRVLQNIREFTTQFHQNQFVITCRIAAREYTFTKFNEVEIADFDFQQIVSFTDKWFQAKNDIVKAEQIRQKLEEDKPIQDLATSPLLLTLLCLVFEGSGSFPTNRSELYKEGLDVLLKKWDVNRNIERDQVYKKLSLNRKEDLLSQIAQETFERSEYFFKQKDIERHISKYISNLPEAHTDLEALQLDSEAVLKSIEVQHGLFVERARDIYSFSHLTFHEYFTARKLVSSSNPYAAHDETLQALAAHITEKRWREIFLLMVGMLERADCLLQLMKCQIDTLLATDEILQQFLSWADLKSSSVATPYKRAAIRAFYLDLVLDRDLDRSNARALVRALDRDIDCSSDLDLNLDFAFIRVLDRVLNLALDLDLALKLDLDSSSALDRDLALNLDLDFALDRDLDLARSPELQMMLLELKKQLSDISKNWKNTKQWWQTNGQAWIEQLRNVMIEHHNIGHDWQFNDSQKQLLQQYYDANKLLVDCLNSECYVSRSVRQEIEDTLLLPVNRS